MNRHDFLKPTPVIAVVACAMAVALSIPPMRSLIEQSMFWHMVIQMPMLAFGGWFAINSFSHAQPSQLLAHWNRYGLTGFIAAQIIVAYWMLPLAIDRAVVLPQADVSKLATLFFCGVILKHSAERAPAIVQLFFVGTTVSMMIWLGTYFATTNLRLCNAYSLESQTNAGYGIVVLGIALGLAWLMCVSNRLKVSRHRQHEAPSIEPH